MRTVSTWLKHWRPGMKVSTLRDLIAAMGGKLHITAKFPEHSVTGSPA